MSSTAKLIADLKIKRVALEDDLFETVRRHLVLKQASAIGRDYRFDPTIEQEFRAFEYTRNMMIFDAFREYFAKCRELDLRISGLLMAMSGSLGFIGLDGSQEVSCNTVYLPKVVEDLSDSKKKEGATFIVLLLHSKKAYVYYYREKTQSFENPQPLNFDDMMFAWEDYKNFTASEAAGGQQ